MLFLSDFGMDNVGSDLREPAASAVGERGNRKVDNIA